jgi:hypothetical protein
LPGDLWRFSTPFKSDLSYFVDVSSLLISPGNIAMTYCSTYIGDLADPSFHCDGGDWNGNIPRGIGPAFPKTLEHYPALGHYNSKFFDWTGRTKVTRKQTDYGGWVARVTRAQLLDFIRFCYGSDQHEEVDKLIDFVNTLEESGEYALVAEEY